MGGLNVDRGRIIAREEGEVRRPPQAAKADDEATVGFTSAACVGAYDNPPRSPKVTVNDGPRMQPGNGAADVLRQHKAEGRSRAGPNGAGRRGDGERRRRGVGRRCRRAVEWEAKDHRPGETAGQHEVGGSPGDGEAGVSEGSGQAGRSVRFRSLGGCVIRCRRRHRKPSHQAPLPLGLGRRRALRPPATPDALAGGGVQGRGLDEWVGSGPSPLPSPRLDHGHRGSCVAPHTDPDQSPRRQRELPHSPRDGTMSGGGDDGASGGGDEVHHGGKGGR